MPRPLFRALAALTAAAALGACDCVKCAQGTTVDARTGVPLAGVRCRETSTGDEVTTDATGAYRVCGAVAASCPHPSATFSKTGYVTRTLENPGSTVTLEPELAPRVRGAGPASP